MKRELLLGAGKNLRKKITIGGAEDWSNLTTLDINPDHMPDICTDLEDMPYDWAAENTYDEVHAYEVLEHLGRQGDWRFFFRQWWEFWRMLRPGGLFCGTSRALSSVWLWGDPGHTRAVTPESFVFLSQPKYAAVEATPMSDYRFVWRGDFDTIHTEVQDGTFIYVLRAIKPSRIQFAASIDSSNRSA